MKRLFDIVISTVSIVVLSPLLCLLAVLIKIDSDGPVFYRGERTGLRGKMFRIFKFRTMVVNAENVGGQSTSNADPRITRIGHFLRRYKLDELPQFFNVFKGDMSMVGPRPEVKRFTDMYSAEEKCILSVRPGITDWASIMFSDEGAILAAYPDADKAYMEVIRPQKLKLQLQYVHERSFFKDIAIVFQTVSKVLVH